MVPTVHLITGSARGIGFSLVQELSARPNTIVYAGVRSLPLAADSPLAALIAKLPEVIFPIQINSADEADNAKAAELVKAKQGKVDVLIANAGICAPIAPVSGSKPSTMLNEFTVNTIGPIVLFNAFSSLLQAAGGSAKFVVISSAAGSITDAVPFALNTYGATKAAINFLTKKIDIETPSVIAFPMHPGMVTTDMGNTGLAQFGFTAEQVGAISPTESAKGILSVVDGAEKESHGGKFWSYDGSELKY